MAARKKNKQQKINLDRLLGKAQRKKGKKGPKHTEEAPPEAQPAEADEEFDEVITSGSGDDIRALILRFASKQDVKSVITQGRIDGELRTMLMATELLGREGNASAGGISIELRGLVRDYVRDVVTPHLMKDLQSMIDLAKEPAAGSGAGGAGGGEGGDEVADEPLPVQVAEGEEPTDPDEEPVKEGDLPEGPPATFLHAQPPSQAPAYSQSAPSAGPQGWNVNAQPAQQQPQSPAPVTLPAGWGPRNS